MVRVDNKKKEDNMSKNDGNVKAMIQEKVAAMIEEITVMVREHEQESTREKLAALLGDLPVTGKRVVNATKHNYTRKHCPVPGCTNLSAPRYHQICMDHGRLFKEQGEAGRKQMEAIISAAKAPGGMWYVEAREKQKRGRKPKAVATVAITPAATAATAAG